MGINNNWSLLSQTYTKTWSGQPRFELTCHLTVFFRCTTLVLTVGEWVVWQPCRRTPSSQLQSTLPGTWALTVSFYYCYHPSTARLPKTLLPLRTFDCSVFTPIVHISVIDKSESTDCHLLAVTHAGNDHQVAKERESILPRCRTE